MCDFSNIREILDKEVLNTKTPANYYLTVITISGLFLFFSQLAIIGRLDLAGSLLCFLFFSVIIYANFGRYLARIKLYSHRIEVHFLFPWNTTDIFVFNKLTQIDHKERPWLLRYNRWYRGHQWLYLENEIGQVCQIRYNINNRDDEKLLELLKTHL